MSAIRREAALQHGQLSPGGTGLERIGTRGNTIPAMDEDFLEEEEETEETEGRFILPRPCIISIRCTRNKQIRSRRRARKTIYPRGQTFT